LAAVLAPPKSALQAPGPGRLDLDLLVARELLAATRQDAQAALVLKSAQRLVPGKDSVLEPLWRLG
jgi:hypothetical protein